MQQIRFRKFFEITKPVTKDALPVQIGCLLQFHSRRKAFSPSAGPGSERQYCICKSILVKNHSVITQPCLCWETPKKLVTFILKSLRTQ